LRGDRQHARHCHEDKHPSHLCTSWRRPYFLATRGAIGAGCSLHYKRTGSLAEVAELLGDSKRVAADHYVYALTDYREVDRSIALARAGESRHSSRPVSDR